MIIRRANLNDIHSINRLMYQISQTHAKIRPDIFVANAKKYSDGELVELIEDFNRPCFVAVNEQGALCFAYLIFWIALWNKNGKLKALSLSLIPSAVFLFSSIMLAYIPLAIFAVLFGITHVLLSYKNAINCRTDKL